MTMTQDFRGDLDHMLGMIVHSTSLAFARYADGEAGVLRNRTIGNKDGWLYTQDLNLAFRRDLRLSLECADPGYFYGLSCRCCDAPTQQFLLAQLKAPLTQVTYSNLWVNANYPTFQQRFLKEVVASGRKIVLCTGSKARVSDFSRDVPVADFIPIKGNCVKTWERHRDHLRGLMDLKATQHRGAIFLFAIGPLSEVLIHQMWQANRNNVYVDIGSTLDPMLFRRNSRDYHKGDRVYSQRVCEW